MKYQNLMAIICMKCQNLFSEEKLKNTFILSSAELALRVVIVNPCPTELPLQTV